MRGREMHPLCCISIDCPGIGHRSPDPEADGPAQPGAAAAAVGNGVGEVTVAGWLYKWTNYGKGWRSRWFTLRRGVLSYSKIPRADDEDARLIGDASARLLLRSRGRERRQEKAVSVVYLKISSFRESKSDGRRFYVLSPTKTLHLRTESYKDRVTWIEALVSARNLFSMRCLSSRISSIKNDLSFSAEKLTDRMRKEGLGESLIKDCEQIMLSEIAECQKHMKHHYEEQLGLLGSFQLQLEDANAENETSRSPNRQFHLLKHEYSSSRRNGKFSEYSTTESSDDVDKQELDDLSSEDEPAFFDATDLFIDSNGVSATMISVTDSADRAHTTENHFSKVAMMNVVATPAEVGRRKKLPEPAEKEKGISLWSMIKDNVGKDLTRVCLPVYFNEPLSSLQKCFEDLEYSHLLDQAYEFGKKGNNLMRILKVAAFAVSGYASSDGRLCKPFNPLLGETYEADYPEKGIRFFSEKVSHHPVLIACHCEGRGWKLWGDSNLKSKFWGQSIQLDPVGTLSLEFDDGEVFQWSKVTTTIYNLILGKIYCNHHGQMVIQGNRQYSCKLKFKEHSLLDRNPRQVLGFIEDDTGSKVATLIGKWDDSIYYAEGDDISKAKSCSAQNGSLLWKRSQPPVNPTRYNLTSFAITLNELTPELQEKLPPTDSRLRPDQRHLENGEYAKANTEKLRLEKRQRMSRKMQEDGWKPKWFLRDNEHGTFRYVGGYWEAREQKKWDGCPRIFGEFSEVSNDTIDPKPNNEIP